MMVDQCLLLRLPGRKGDAVCFVRLGAGLHIFYYQVVKMCMATLGEQLLEVRQLQGMLELLSFSSTSPLVFPVSDL
jgi:hypothetical protein